MEQRIKIGNTFYEPSGYIQQSSTSDVPEGAFFVKVKGDCLDTPKHKVKSGSLALCYPPKNDIEIINHVGKMVAVIINGQPCIKELVSTDLLNGRITLGYYFPRETKIAVPCWQINQFFLVKRIIKQKRLNNVIQ